MAVASRSRRRLPTPVTWPDYRVQRDGGADAGEGDDHLEEAACEHARVGAGAEDPVPVVFHDAEEGEGRNGDEGGQVEDAGDERGLPH